MGMMHRNRSRDPPPYHPGWGGLARKLVLKENTVYASIVIENKLIPEDYTHCR